MEREDRLNQVLVHLFNDALRIEEAFARRLCPDAVVAGSACD